MNTEHSLPRTALFDLDGTLALHVKRNPYQWQKAASDTPNEPVIATLQALHRDGVTIVYLSGRPEEARAITTDWITRHVGVDGPLYLRASSDMRKDAIIKREIYEAHIRKQHHVIAVFDDRDQVVAMWRKELRLTCFQVAYGDF